MNNKKINVRALKYLHWVLLASVMMLSSGCSWLFGDQGYFRERTMDYKKAQEANPIRFPKGTRTTGVTELYPIPHVQKQGGFSPLTGEDIPRPQSLLSVDEDSGIELRGDGSVTWLVVEQDYESLWSTLTAFLLASGMDVETEDKSSRIIETVWLKPRIVEEEGFWSSLVDVFDGDDKENTREKFLFTLQPVGSESSNGNEGAFEVKISHVTRIRTDEGLPAMVQSDWDEGAENTELLDVLYAEVSDYISGERNRQAHASIMAQTLTAMPSYLMTRDGNGYPVLMMQMDLNRAWIKVGAAIKKAKLTLNDLNLSLGIYYLSIDVEGQEEPQIVEVKLISAENGVQVAVQLDDDTIAPIEISDKLLTAISEKLG